MSKYEPTHRCTICGALWIKWDEEPAWSLGGDIEPGECCDNSPMGDQIEALPAREAG